MKTQKAFAVFVVWSLVTSQLSAQQSPQTVEKAHAIVLVRPYLPTTMPPVQLKNSNRLHDLIRGGKLYLTVQDAIALAMENDVDLEVDRYGPLSAEWNLKRAQAGGPLRGVTAGNTLSNQAVSGQGVQGSEASAGLVSSGGGSGSSGSSGIIQQIGPITPNLDAAFQNTSEFAHLTSPQPNTTVSQTPALVNTEHIFDSSFTQGLITGGTLQIAGNESYLKQNAPTNLLNPSVAPVVQIYIQHSLLQGFGVAMNRRTITIAEMQVGGARETFRSQLLNTVANVLNLYWALVAADDELRIRRNALDAAQKFLEDTKKQISLGAVARSDVYRPESDLSTREQELAISQVNVQQRESDLKNVISRNGTQDPLVDATDIVPLDHVEVPAEEELPGLRDLLARALAKRPDVALAKLSDRTGEISALGTRNSLLPTLRGTYQTWNIGQAGTPVPGAVVEPYFVGGLGNALGQVFRRNFYNQREALNFNIPLWNRQAQADDAIDQLQLRQGDLVERRNMNAIVVAISNQMTALRQARSRYRQAVDSRTLQEQLLEKEEQMFSFGTAQPSDVVAARASLLAAQLTELQAIAAYGNAKVALDQVLGETLETNHVSIEEALQGRVSRESKLPAK
jgi:outer membrane protein TolC